MFETGLDGHRGVFSLKFRVGNGESVRVNKSLRGQRHAPMSLR